jgi:signal transduction histidine kinase
VICCVAFLLNVFGNLLHLPVVNRASLFIIFIGQVVTGWGIAFHRVFDAKHVFLSLAQRALILFVASGGVFCVWSLFKSTIDPAALVLLGTAIFGGIAIWLHDVSFRLLDLNGESALAQARRSVIDLVTTDYDSDTLLLNFQTILASHFNSRHVAILSRNSGNYSGGGFLLAMESQEFLALCKYEWITKARLERQKPNPASAILNKFCTDNSIECLVAIPCGGNSPALIIAMAGKTDDWVFTYPEIQRIQNLGELMDNILTHSRLASQAAMKAKMEHLTFMSRGLAHDLKNLLTPVSSFIVHTEKQLRLDSAESEVHALAKRSLTVMTGYLREVITFAERQEPNIEDVDVRTLALSITNSCGPRADARHVCLSFQLSGDFVFSADFVLLQRMLTNIVNNAIDASACGREVVISAAVINNLVRLQVVDEGCGIASENLARIFEPYFTTKRLGDESRGFGLGLTVADKIVKLHRGTIAIDSEEGHGTCVTIELPRGAADAKFLHSPVMRARWDEPVASIRT